MKKFMNVLLLLAMLAGLWLPALANETQDWVVFVYLCGTDLESEGGAATSDLIEMIEAGAGGNIRFVVQTGGTAQWMAEDVIPSDRAARFDIYDEDMFALWEGPLENMGDAATLSGFLDWGFEQYSAQRYGLVLWNHGSGSINGVCFDELHDFDSLSLAEIVGALSGYESAFEFVGFDACLMATIETAQAVSPFADYMIASEELEPGSGWDYKAFGSFLRENPQADGAQLGRVVADSFLYFNQENGDEEISTLSVTRLAAIPALAQAMNAAGWKMLEAAANSARLKDITRGIHRAENYGGNTPEEGYTNMVDIGSMMREIEGALPEARMVLEALDEAVVYRVAGSGRQQSTGLSVYYPLQVQGSQEYEVFKAASPSEGYRRFVAGMLYGAQSGDAAGYVSQQEEQGEDDSWFDSVLSVLDEAQPQPGFSSSQQSQLEIMDAYLDEEGSYILELSPDSMDYLLTATFTLLMDEGEGILYSLGEDDELEIDEEGGIIRDAFAGMWTALPDGQLISLYLLEQAGEYNLYSAPVKLNGRETNLRVLYDWDKEAFRVIGGWDGLDENGASGKEIIKIKPGDSIVPLYEAYDEESGEYLGMEEGEAYAAQDGFTIEYMQLPAAGYYYSFTLTDLFGLETYTDFALFEVDEEGEIWFDAQ